MPRIVLALLCVGALALGGLPARAQEGLLARRVSLQVPPWTTLRAALAQLEQAAGEPLGIELAPELDPDRLFVELRLLERPLGEVLTALAEQTGLVLHEGATLRLEPAPPRPPGWWDQLLLRELEADPRRFAALSARLDTERLTLDFAARPLGEVLDVLRGESGLGLIAQRAGTLEGWGPVTLSWRGVSLREALDELLGDRGLGLSYRRGFLWIVPLAEATLRSPASAALLTRPCPGPRVEAGSAEDLPPRLEAAGVERVFLERGDEDGRLMLPGDAPSVRAVLELARLQLSLRYAVCWPGGRPCLVLDLDARPALVEALEASEAPAPDLANAPELRVAWMRRQAELGESLDELERVFREVVPSGALRWALEAVHAARAELRGLDELAAYASAPEEDRRPELLACLERTQRALAARARARAAREQAARGFTRQREALARVSAQEERDLRQLDESARQVEAFQQEVEGYERLLGELPAGPAADEATARLELARAELRAGEAELEGRAAALAEVRRRQSALRAELARVQGEALRGRLLPEQRAEEVLARERERLRELFPTVLLQEALREVAGALRLGEGHPALEGYPAWRRGVLGDAQATLSRGLAAWERLGLSFTVRGRELEVEATHRPRTLLAPGDRLLAVNGEEVSNLADLVRALGQRREGGPQLRRR